MTEITAGGEDLGMKMARMLAVIGQEASMPRDGSGAVAAVTAGILSATTLEGILDAAELGGISMDDLLGVPLLLKAVEWGKSTIVGTEEFPYYAILTFQDLINNQEVVATTGARSVLLQVFALADNEMLPAPVEVKKKTSAGSGNDFFYLGQMSRANQRYAPKVKAEK